MSNGRKAVIFAEDPKKGSDKHHLDIYTDYIYEKDKDVSLDVLGTAKNYLQRGIYGEPVYRQNPPKYAYLEDLKHKDLYNQVLGYFYDHEISDPDQIAARRAHFGDEHVDSELRATEQAKAVLKTLLKDDVELLTKKEWHDKPGTTTEDIFPGQARWWARKNPDYDTEIISYYGEEELDKGIKELKESGFFTEGEIDAIIMGHSSNRGKYGGVGPGLFGEVLEENFIDDKIDRVLLGSCNMGNNPVACMNISKAFGGAPVSAQGNLEGGYYAWGTGAIDSDSLGNPDASLQSRVFVENAPYTTYTKKEEEEDNWMDSVYNWFNE